MHRMGRIQGHDLPHPWSIGIFCRSIIDVRRTFKVIAAQGGQPAYGVFDGGILLSKYSRGSKGFFMHYVVGKGSSDAKLNYVGFHR